MGLADNLIVMSEGHTVGQRSKEQLAHMEEKEVLMMASTIDFDEENREAV